MVRFPGGPAIRPRRFTLLDVVFLVAMASLVLAAIGSTGRSAHDGSTVMIFAAAALTAHFLMWLLFLAAGAWAGERSAWSHAGLFGFYNLAGLTFLFQIGILVLIEPFSGLLVHVSLLAMAFYWVSWS